MIVVGSIWNKGCTSRMLLYHTALVVYYVKTCWRTWGCLATVLACAVFIAISSPGYRVVSSPVVMEGSTAAQAIGRSFYSHRVRPTIICTIVLLIINKKARIALNWFIREWLLRLLLLVFLIVWGLLQARAWSSIRLLLLILFWYLFLFSDHILLWLTVGGGDISHLLSNNCFLKVMIHNFLFRLLFVIVERLMHSANNVVALWRLWMFAWKEFLLCNIVRL